MRRSPSLNSEADLSSGRLSHVGRERADVDQGGRVLVRAKECQLAASVEAAGLRESAPGSNQEAMPAKDSAATSHLLQQRVVNPVVLLAWRLGIPPPGDALLETTGRRTGRPRYTPVCNGLDGQAFWLVAQDGRRADWVRNIEANPRVRVKVASWPRTRWLAGTAQILDDDNTRERLRILGQANLARRLCFCTSAALNTSPLTVRIDLDASGGRSD